MSNKETSIGIKLVADLRNYLDGMKKGETAGGKFGDNVEKKIIPPLRAMQNTLQKLRWDQNKALTPEQWNKYGEQIKKVQGEMDRFRGKTTQSGGAISSLMNTAKGLLPVLGFAAVIAGAKSLITNIINVRKEFEKYEAILTNTLGSSKQARQEMSMLQKFSAETPFALTELTGAYVKLVNYGLKPTREEMRQYGDLASSVGKGFDQLAEAMADAVTGEFERLKEFGIKAKKEGEKITFTFKEQSTVIDNNATAIKTYIAGLGNLQGISGAMAAITEKLGGKISNMGDAWDNLMNTLGAGSSGIMITIINWTTVLINNLNSVFTSIEKIKQAVSDDVISSAVKNGINEVNDISSSLIKNGMTREKAEKRARELYLKSIDDQIKAAKKLAYSTEETDRKKGQRMLDMLQGEKQGVINHYNKLDEIEKKRKEEIEKATTTDKTRSAQIAALNKELDQVNDTDTESIRIISAKIEALKKEQTAIESIRKSLRNEAAPAQITNQKTINSLETTAPDTKGLADMGQFLDENAKKAGKLRGELSADNWQSTTDNIYSLSDSFGMLGYSIGGAAGSFLELTSQIISMIPTLIAQITALTVAQSSSSTSVIAGKTGEAYASGTAEAMKVPFPLNIIALAATIGSIVMALTKIPKFATGGVVGGMSYMGDRIPIMVNSGEEIVQRANPRHILNQGSASRQQQQTQQSTIKLEARIGDDAIYLSNKRHATRVSRRT